MNHFDNSTVLCPGCHFRCQIEDYQCRRGQGIFERWQETGELPERRIPGMKPDGAAGPAASAKSGRTPAFGEGAPDREARMTDPASEQAASSGSEHAPSDKRAIPDGRLMHMLNVFAHAVHHLGEEQGLDAPERRFADSLMRHGKAASRPIVDDRSRLGEEFDEVAHTLTSEGLIELETAPNGCERYKLTDAGVGQAKSWESERKAAEAEFLSPLDESDKRQLHDLLLTLMMPQFKKRADGSPASRR